MRDTILHLNGNYDVRRDGRAFTVYRNTSTHAVSVQTFADQSLAIAYANYLAGARGKATLDGATA